MSIRNPVRLLDIADITKAYPLELLADFSTGNFTLVKSDGSTIEHKKPGTLTVSYGSTILLNAGNLFDALSVTIPEVTNISGNAGTATKLNTAVNIGISGGATGTAQSFDGSGDITIPITSLDATKLSGLVPSACLPTIYQPSTTTPLAAGTAAVGTSDTFARADHIHPLQTSVSGNAGTATKLASAINITIGNTTKSFDGSSDLSWALSEIGVASHTHSEYLAISGGTLTGGLTVPGLTVSTAGNVSGIAVVYTATISTSWSGSAAPYSQTITVSGLRATDVPIVDFVNSGTYATDQAREEAWGQVYRIVPADNAITVYAHAATTTACPIQLVVIR